MWKVSKYLQFLTGEQTFPGACGGVQLWLIEFGDGLYYLDVAESPTRSSLHLAAIPCTPTTSISYSKEYRRGRASKSVVEKQLFRYDYLVALNSTKFQAFLY